MARFKNVVLGVLERIYGFVSESRSMSQFQLEVPIQPVHDVSREAELGTGMGRFGGWAIVNTQLTHAAANTQRTTFDVYGTLGAHGDFGTALNEEDMDAWLFDVAVDQNNTQLTSLALALSYPPAMPAGPANTYFPIWYGETEIFVTTYNGAAAQRVTIQDQLVGYPGLLTRLPRYIPHGETRITVVSVSAAALIVNVNLLLWVGKRGTTPPGVR